MLVFFFAFAAIRLGLCVVRFLLSPCGRYHGSLAPSSLPEMAPPFALRCFTLLLAICCGRVAAQEDVLPPHDIGCIHMPIIHSTNVNHFSEKRGVQLQLANRSDVAYYAQRMGSLLLRGLTNGLQ